MNRRKARLDFLKVLYDQVLESENDWALKMPDMVQRSGIKEKEVKHIWVYLVDLGYAYTPDKGNFPDRPIGRPGRDSVIMITPKGIVYYEDEISKPQRERQERRRRYGDIAFGAVLASFVKDFLPWIFKILLAFLQK